MRKKSRYYLEIDVTDRECDRYAQWANYGTLTAEGNSLDECLESAQVDIMDQDGGELDVCRADCAWMQDLIEAEYLSDPDRAAEHAEAGQARRADSSDEQEREGM